MNSTTLNTSPKKVGFLLSLGILFVPLIFTWLLLKQGYSRTAKIVGFAWLGVATLLIIVNDSGSGSRSTENFPAAPAISAPSTPAPLANSKPIPAKLPAPAKKEISPIAKDTAKVAEIEQRLDVNAKSLRTHYGSADQLTQLQKDLIQLAMLKVEYSDMGKTTDEKALGKKATGLGSKVEMQSREIYASMLEEGFMKSGIDAKVSATGSKKDQLRITYALMSKPLVYKFQNELRLGEKAASFGFRNIVYSNGFESDLGRTWTVDLKK